MILNILDVCTEQDDVLDTRLLHISLNFKFSF